MINKKNFQSTKVMLHLQTQSENKVISIPYSEALLDQIKERTGLDNDQIIKTLGRLEEIGIIKREEALVH